jgi:hypothetical protein
MTASARLLVAADTDPLGGGFVDVKIEEELPDHLELSLLAKRPEVNAGHGKRMLFSGNPAEQELVCKAVAGAAFLIEPCLEPTPERPLWLVRSFVGSHKPRK